MMDVIVNLLKYNKSRVNWQHYSVKLTEQEVLEQTLSEEAIEELLED